VPIKRTNQAEKIKWSKITPRRKPLRGRGLTSIVGKTSHVTGPGPMPPGFKTPWNSEPEWILYWACWQVLHEKGDPRQPPFRGGLKFSYQNAIGGGRTSLGGQVIDFVILTPHRKIGLFLQSDRYHIEKGSAMQHALDMSKLLSAARFMKVVAVYEKDLTSDPTGELACRKLVETLGGRQQLNPITSGTYRPTRMGLLFGRL
jgi:hypothetical protein